MLGRRRLPEKRPAPLRAAVLGPLPSNCPALLSAAAQRLQSCRPQSRSPALLRRQARLPWKLARRLPGTLRLSLQRPCPRRLQARTGEG